MKKLKERNKNFTKITNNQSGITLIALIVTIIVLIIIAGISIATLTADNGILRQVNSAKVVQIEGTAREQVKLATAAMRLAIAEASAKDNSYSAVQHANAIQAELLATIRADSTSLDENEDSWTSSGANNGDTEFTITYAGQDYKNACNDDNAEIVYTIGLSQRTIEITNETNTTLKDQNGNNVVFDIGSNEGTGSGSGTGSGGSGNPGECVLYFGEKYSYIQDGTKVSSIVLYEDGSAKVITLQGKAPYECKLFEVSINLQEDDGLVTFGTVSSDGTQIQTSDDAASTFVLESNDGAVQSECGLYFGKEYIGTIDENKYAFIFYEDGTYNLYYIGALQEGTCTYTQYEVFINGTMAATINSDGTQAIYNGNTYTLETGSYDIP